MKRTVLKRPQKAGLVARVGVKGFEFVLGKDVDPKKIGGQLRKLRSACLVAVGDLAEHMQWNPQNVLRMERGGAGREPTISSLNKYLRMLGFELVLVARPRARQKLGEDDAEAKAPDDASGDEG